MYFKTPICKGVVSTVYHRPDYWKSSTQRVVLTCQTCIVYMSQMIKKNWKCSQRKLGIASIWCCPSVACCEIVKVKNSNEA